MQDGELNHTFHVETAHESAAGDVRTAVRIALEAGPPDGVTLWLPSLAPRRALAEQFSCDDFQWHAFCRRYHKELNRRERPCELIRGLACKRSLVLTYRTGDDRHNVAIAMKQHLEQLECKRRYAAGWIIGGLAWPVRGEIQRCGGLWFARHKAWTMPSRESWKHIQSLLPGDF